MNNPSEQKNLILAIAVSMAILLGFNYLFPGTTAPPPEQAQQQGGQPGTADLPAPGMAVPPAAPGIAAPPQAVAPTRDGALVGAQRVAIDTPRLGGSIALTGGRLDDLTLKAYHVQPDSKSPLIDLLSPPGAPQPYYVEFGWVPAAGQPVAVPGPTTQWQATGGPLTPRSPVTLTWDNGQGLQFVRTFSVDENYMFSVAQKVINTTQQAVTLHPYGLIARTGKPADFQDMYILHEGPLGVFDGTLREVDYSELEESKTPITAESTGGWIGITDKYWLTALVPGTEEHVQMRLAHRLENASHKYQIDFMGPAIPVPAGGTAEDTSHVFAGAKQLALLDAYGEKYNITNFDLAIDFGWFYFMTKPFFYALTWLYGFLGNFGLAILALTVGIKLLFFPLANKSYVAMSKMKKLHPEIQKMQERFADDKMRMNQELMALYKREKVNPVSGCLPIVIQIPVFFALYKVLYGTIEMRHAPFYGWVSDLSAPDPTSLFNLFGLIPWEPPMFLMIGIWPIIMGVTMFLQQKLNPQPTDPVQAKMFTFLPFLFTFLLASFPAGLVIYWAWSNTLSIAQQWVIMRRQGVKM